MKPGFYQTTKASQEKGFYQIDQNPEIRSFFLSFPPFPLYSRPTNQAARIFYACLPAARPNEQLGQNSNNLPNRSHLFFLSEDEN
ncbi:uncharacterized protein DFL_009644 [Arthrobotrys flagrans]|uniref:Uncharacterized protein n=1 Tax=Arthrobotrys flagrans TaxID=97331 RepID=A0A436ZS90_ARTFL|nr:hypothetical protein DFL_009644 [Arthrobotrys flagrans]